MTATDARRPARPRRRDDPAPSSKPPPTPAGEDDDVLPPGQRDGDGFWFPAGHEAPADLFTPQQRRAQERQRALHRSRRGGPKTPPADPGAR